MSDTDNTRYFSDAFTSLLNSYADQNTPGQNFKIVLDEYEKSLYLSQAQTDIIINLYSGKNVYGDSFESTEEIRRYLDGLVKTKNYTISDQVEGNKVHTNSVLFKLPPDIAFITMEQITYEDESLGCYNGSIASVYPVKQDEYSKVRNNPFRGPTKYKAIRLDSGESIVELISKYKIGEYTIKYLAIPEPIILEDLPDGLNINGKTERKGCELNPILFDTIIERAVRIALQTKSIAMGK